MTMLPPEVVTLGGTGDLAGVRGCSTIVPEVPFASVERRDSVGDGEGDQGVNVAVSKVDAEMSPAEAGTYDGGAFMSLDFIV